MPPDIRAWRRVVRDAVDDIADEALQRRAWFGGGPEVLSVTETINHFFSDAAFEEFLRWPGTGVDTRQLELGDRLLSMMSDYCDATPQFLDPRYVIDDPNWREIRSAAADFLNAFSADTTEP